MAALRRIGVPFLRGFLRPGTSTSLPRPSLDSGAAVVQCRRSSDEPYAPESPPVPGTYQVQGQALGFNTIVHGVLSL